MRAFEDDELQSVIETWEDNRRNRVLTAAKLGLSKSGLSRRLEAAKERGMVAEISSLYVKGRSTLYGPDGEKKLEWLKEDTDKEALWALANMAADACLNKIEPVPEVKPGDIFVDDMLTSYNIGDAHAGAYCWRMEAEEDFDLNIWERDLLGAIDRLVEAAPPTYRCIMLNLGDWFHADDTRNVTPASGNSLDTDSRWPKVVRTGIRAQRYAIDKMLRKHHYVHIVEVAGNHDPHAVLILVEAMRALYENNPRVIIEDTSRYLWAMEYGKNLIAACHGDKAKPKSLASVLASDYAAQWGRTEFRTVWHGHWHSASREEHPGCSVEGFRSLVAKDKWHWDNGYRSIRDMQAVVLHEEYGEIERHTAGLKLARATRAGA